MEKHYLYNLINEGESLHLDFKHSINDSKKIARSLAAFANTDGGTLLIGVRDNGSIAGISSDEEYYMVETASHLYCKPEVNFETKPWPIEGKTVLEVSIPKSKERPHFAPTKDNKWRAFIRVNDENKVANKIQTEVWKRLKEEKPTFVKYTEKEKWLLKYLEDNQYITFSKFRRTARISSYRAEKTLINLVAIGVLQIRFDDKSVKYELSNEENLMQSFA